MAEPVSISKSVGRAFGVLEMFRDVREPITAAEIGRRLALPQPSTRALLKTLVNLDYLAYSATDRRYFPTAQLATLGQWLTTEQAPPANLVRATDRVATLTDETTSLCGLRDGRVEILHVRKAQHPVALQLEPGVGVAAWRTAVGRCLLAALAEAESSALLATWLRAERSLAGRRILQGLPRGLQRLRAEGHVTGYDLFLKGVGAICVPVPRNRAPTGHPPLVLAIAGLNDRIRTRELAFLKILRGELRRVGQAHK